MPKGYKARVEQAILFSVEAWDVNCPQHIPQKIDATEVRATIGELQARITALESENRRLRSEREPAGAMP